MFNYVSKCINISFFVEIVPVVYLPKCKQYKKYKFVQKNLKCLQNCFYVILTFWKYTWLPERWNFYPYICTLYPFICEWIEVGKSLKITIGPKLLQKKVSSKIKIILTYIFSIFLKGWCSFQCFTWSKFTISK